MPGINAVGMKTAARISAIAIDRPGHFLHRLEAGVFRRQALLDMVLDRLDDHDGVVHDQADGQHQPEQGQRVDGETEQRKQRERADQRDRYGQQRDQGGPPALQEEEDDDDDEHQRFKERMHDLVDTLSHGQRRIERGHIIQVRREPRLHLLHELVRARPWSGSRWIRGADKWR